jgi:hypothetical protein
MLNFDIPIETGSMRGLLFIISLAIVAYSPAQAKENEDTTKANILVVPFMPQMYVATGDYFICKKSALTPGQLSEMMRKSLSATLVHNLGEYYNTVEIPGYYQPNSYNDVSLMYKSIKINYKRQKIKAYYKSAPTRGIFASGNKKWGSDCINSDSETPGKKRHKFADAVISNDSVFSEVCEKNKAAYVLLITQFEMYTRFKTCLDLQENIYQRDFYVHYVLYTKDGKKVDGGVVATTWESTSNNAKEIMEQNLSTLSGLMIDFCRKCL